MTRKRLIGLGVLGLAMAVDSGSKGAGGAKLKASAVGLRERLRAYSFLLP